MAQISDEPPNWGVRPLSSESENEVEAAERQREMEAVPDVESPDEAESEELEEETEDESEEQESERIEERKDEKPSEEKGGQERKKLASGRKEEPRKKLKNTGRRANQIVSSSSESRPNFREVLSS